MAVLLVFCVVLRPYSPVVISTVLSRVPLTVTVTSVGDGTSKLGRTPPLSCRKIPTSESLVLSSPPETLPPSLGPDTELSRGFCPQSCESWFRHTRQGLLWTDSALRYSGRQGVPSSSDFSGVDLCGYSVKNLCLHLGTNSWTSV